MIEPLIRMDGILNIYSETSTVRKINELVSAVNELQKESKDVHELLVEKSCLSTYETLQDLDKRLSEAEKDCQGLDDRIDAVLRLPKYQEPPTEERRFTRAEVEMITMMAVRKVWDRYGLNIGVNKQDVDESLDEAIKEGEK